MALRRVGFLARARYLDADLAVTGTSGLPSLKSDQFYRKSPITAAREYLELRGTAVPLEEVLDGLTRGGFDFEHQLWTEELRLKNLGISLGKNSGIFHRLPNNTWGLTKKYGIKERKPSGKKGGKSDATETAEVSEDVSTDEQTKTANAE
ncbi:MAG TPA: hypothetical protein VGN86_14770 [Pyrinomonadaceae bacterium]|jgi:hypothetical protein|nr:hypothetical protein [Pyrinomonadaceae bacterium]